MNFRKTRVNPICILRFRALTLSIKTLKNITNLNEGSHTRLIQYKINSPTQISIAQKDKRKIRYVWLGTSLHKKITFARSLCKTCEINKKNTGNITTKPIGLSFIKNKTDINKYFYEVYYYHCKKLERDLIFNNPLWGRKYIIYEFKKQQTIVQEFFSTQVIL